MGVWRGREHRFVNDWQNWFNSIFWGTEGLQEKVCAWLQLKMGAICTYTRPSAKITLLQPFFPLYSVKVVFDFSFHRKISFLLLRDLRLRGKATRVWPRGKSTRCFPIRKMVSIWNGPKKPGSSSTISSYLTNFVEIWCQYGDKKKPSNWLQWMSSK